MSARGQTRGITSWVLLPLHVRPVVNRFSLFSCFQTSATSQNKQECDHRHTRMILICLGFSNVTVTLVTWWRESQPHHEHKAQSRETCKPSPESNEEIMMIIWYLFLFFWFNSFFIGNINITSFCLLKWDDFPFLSDTSFHPKTDKTNKSKI